MGVIQVIDSNNVSHILEAVEGWRVMEIIREHGFDVGGLCGGACACATCHVEIHSDWVGKLSPANGRRYASSSPVFRGAVTRPPTSRPFGPCYVPNSRP